ncbi:MULTISPECIES: transferrin-binding protein-like solute binding protein [unclassified Neisseria]|uniref:transferrin-binding protein-like solute binding protein n=1 Tax=unclassified Neisseria TaxID=2623750 RepID=UPI0026659091|nr:MULTISPECIES: transferrin-binding protein-like solute binding protein [unclassified Neisseria]MDO1509456.1 transferrin-binding protein-like solute binding protein [Neisseria sp. MVDL19-042950]MDO1515771.1 transferrin-binding protein-like solute binding protein [Neisseria sp. MVDL18-041461]MDO1563405.1 transferrin-binding protein-like solute binding protein [Neisseria sp. MVDL20-010259]
MSTLQNNQNQAQNQKEEKEEGERKKTEEQAKAEAERKNAEEQAKAEAGRKEEELAQAEAERKKAEELAKQEAERKKAEELAKQEAERKKAEELAKQEAERKKAEELAKQEAERKKAEELAKQEAERKKVEELAKAEAERKKAEENAKNQANNNPKPQPEKGGSFAEALAKGFAANDSKKIDFMDSKSVNGILLSIDNASGTVTGQLPPKTEAFNELMLNGTKILLLASAQDKTNGISMRPLAQRDFPNGGYTAEGKGFVGSTGLDPRQDHFQNVRYGVYTVDGKSHLFVQGNPTQTMYRTAKYAYDGHAVYGKDGKYNRATTKAIVDFGKKTVDITITPPNISGQADRSPLKFGGEIKGNTFSGTQNNIETKGGFFGPGGADLGGVYNVKEGEHKGYNGAYGASNSVLLPK